MNVKSSLILAVAFVGLGTVAMAEDTPGKQLAMLTFESMDTNTDKSVSGDELAAFADSVLVSMDADADKKVSLAEFQGWDFGFVNIAEEADKLEGYATAQKIAFDFWDRDNDQSLTAEEMKAAMQREIAYADLDGNGSLNLDEFLMGFTINIVLRGALKDA